MKRPLFLICLCFILLACLRILTCEDAPQSLREMLSGKTLLLTGRVYQKEKGKIYLKSVIIYENAVVLQQNPKQVVKLQQNIICEYEGRQSVKLGCDVTVKGEFVPFSEATNPGEFDADGYYQSLNIIGRITQPEILFVGEEYSVLSEVLYDLRQYWKKRLYKIFPQKEASVMSTMLLGESEGTDRELKALYKRNGIIHILSISGLHITIVGISLYNLLRKCGIPTWLAAVIGGGILLLYGILTGMSISATRAVGMYLLKMLSHICKRTYDMLTALGIMGAVMTILNPGYLRHAGFLLSFLAVLGIGILYPAIAGREQERTPLFPRRYRGKVLTVIVAVSERTLRGIKQSMLSGAAVTLTTLPVLLWVYYEVPVYSMVLNLLIIPFMGMLLCFGLLAMLLPGLGVLGTVDCIILSWYEGLCKLFEGFPFHMWNPGKPKIWQVIIYYVIWLSVVLIGQRVHAAKPDVRMSKRNAMRVLQGMLLTVSVIVFGTGIYDRCAITFLDVGQGDCICVQSESGETYLFDCGSSSRDEVGRYVLLPFLKYSGIRKLNGVFVSHNDSDHKNGVEELLNFAKEEGIVIEKVYLPGEISVGECIQGENISIHCMHPPINFEEEDNASSQCFYVELWRDKEPGKRLSLLLTGDVDGEGEKMLIHQLEQKKIAGSSVLKVAHHGSKYATSEQFLQKFKPQVSVISCGRYNSYGHPHSDTLERIKKTGSLLFTTPECGAVTVSMEDNINVHTFLPLR